MEMGQALRGVVDETCFELMTFEVRKGTTRLLSNFEPHARVRVRGARDNVEKNVRATKCSVFTPRRVHDIR